jgi:hypothetical protein
MKTVQQQSIWLWLSQLTRCAIVLVTLSERNTGGSGLQGYSPVLLGVVAFAKLLTTREGYGPP